MTVITKDQPLTIAEKAEKAIRMIREAPNLIFDVETSGLDWKRNFPIGYVFATSPKDSVYVPIRHLGGCNLEHTPIPPASDSPGWRCTLFEIEMAKAFRLDRADKAGKRTIGHHLKFDQQMAWNVGVYLGRNVSCTQNTQVLIDENSRGFSLAAVAAYYGVAAKKGADLYRHLADTFNIPNNRDTMSHFARLPGNDALAVEYAEQDGVTTGLIHTKQMALIEQQNLQDVWELENKLIWTLVRMERRGIKVDEEELERLEGSINDLMSEARAGLPDSFNENSSKQVREVCEAAGKTDWPTTPKGNPSLTSSWLSGFPEGQRIANIRRYSKILSSFIQPLKTTHIFNGRVHSQLNQLRSDDGGTPARLSSSSPNLQQVPKRDKELAPMFRRIFVADEGFEFWEGDYSQMEPRLYAHYSQAPALVDGYCQEPFKDAHTTVAELLNVERDPTAKRMNMGLLTGMQVKTFSEHMGWELTKAKRAYDAYFEALPEIKHFQDLAMRAYAARGYIKTLLGRRAHLDHPRFKYKAVSRIIQGTAADIQKHRMLAVDMFMEYEGLDDLFQLLMTVHDSFEWQSRISDGQHLNRKAIAMFEDVQRDPFNLSVPFLIEANSGDNWAKATFGK